MIEQFFIRSSDYDDPALIKITDVTCNNNIPYVTVSEKSRNSGTNSNTLRHTEYSMTVESLLEKHGSSARHNDLQVVEILYHFHNGSQAMVQIKWNTDEITWELVSDIQTHDLYALLLYAKREKLCKTKGWK